MSNLNERIVRACAQKWMLQSLTARRAALECGDKAKAEHLVAVAAKCAALANEIGGQAHGFEIAGEGRRETERR